jgi:competence protein ComEC
MAAMLLFGAWRGWLTSPVNTVGGHWLNQSVTLVGTVIDDPGRDSRGQIVFTVGSGSVEGRSLGGNVRVASLGATVRRGYRVAVTGNLREALGASPFEISFANVQVMTDRVGWLEKARAGFFAGTRTVMNEPMSGFGLGLLVGVRSLIDKPLQDTLSLVGLSHLVAVSGYNLTIIIQAVSRIFDRWSLFVTTAFCFWLIFGFLLVAGFSASIVRAAMVSSIGLLTAYYGYEVKPMTLIALPAIITVAINPDYLIRDLGWQLSFLAFFGILVIAPLIQARFVERSNAVKSLFIESTSAHVVTLPLIMLKFSMVSMVAPISNVVVLPLVPLAMLLSFTSGLAGMLVPSIGSWLSLPTTGLLALMIGLAQWFAAWPMASINLPINAPLTVALYLIELVLISILLLTQSHKP